VEDGTPFGRYRLLDLLGRGGMGEVWRAFDTVTERIVALKVLPTEYADDATYQERFRREARAAAALDEPHVVPIHDFGEIDGRLYVTMRLIKGHDLHTILRQGRMAVPRAVAIIDQVASALNAAHRVGLVHRDVKPSNILVGDDDFAYLIDFGIARAAGQSALTNTSSVIGTWAYMAPERMTTSQTDARSDIYALACVLYECLTGSQPFPGESLEQQIGGHIAMPPPRASERHRDVPAQLDDVIAKGMAKNPDERYATTRELAFAARSAVTTPITLPPATTPITPPPTPNPYEPPRPPTQPAYLAGNPMGAPGQSGPIDAGQYRPSTGPNPAWPGQPPPSWPGQPAPNSLPPKSSRNLIIAISSVAVVVIAAIVAAIVIANSGDDKKPLAGPTSPSSSTTSTSAAPEPGPLTGSFTVAFGPTILSDGTPANDPPFTETWRLRSECGENGCVATGTTGGQYPTNDVVFDKLADGSWVAVSLSSARCSNADDEAWNVVTLKPQPDGSFTGEMTAAFPRGCFTKRTATFTPTGNTSVAGLPDPGTLPTRVVSPAEAFYGQYDEQFINANTTPRIQNYHLGVKTNCLRTGDRCISFLIDTNGDGESFVYQNGIWTRNDEYDAPCSTGGTSHSKINSTLTLPQPLQNPITLLKGSGYQEESGSSCASTSFEQTLTRTGD
jgi:serine/threonine-protein kinase